MWFYIDDNDSFLDIGKVKVYHVNVSSYTGCDKKFVVIAQGFTTFLANDNFKSMNKEMFLYQ